MTLRTTALIIILSAIGQACYSQALTRPKPVKAKGTYVHLPSKTEFPEQIGTFKRSSIHTFDKKKENVGSTYDNPGTSLSIYVYPAGSGSEGRLRSEYLHSMQGMANVSRDGIHAVQRHRYFKSDGFRINGFTAVTYDEPKSQLTVFECGQWFFKVRITSNSLDTAQIRSIENDVLEVIKPTQLVQRFPLNDKASIYFAKAAFRDSLMLGSVMGSAYKKVEWALDNVDSLERLAGFPDSYLGLQVESLKALVQFEKRKTWSKQQSTTDYLDELNAIINAGFVEEFVMEQFDMLLIVPDQMVLDFEGFDSWQLAHPVRIDLGKMFYVISYNVPD
jgi:hypothetical protein